MDIKEPREVWRQRETEKVNEREGVRVVGRETEEQRETDIKYRNRLESCCKTQHIDLVYM